MTTQAEAPPEPPGRARRVPVRLVVGLVAIVLAGAAVFVAGRAVFPAVEARGSSAVGIGTAPERRALTVGIVLCMTADGAADLMDVRPVRPTNGFRVVDVGVSHGRGVGIGTSDVPVQELPAYRSKRVVAVCGSGVNGVAVQVAADDYPARARAFEVEYRVRGLTRTTTADLEVVLYGGPVPGL